MNFYKHHIGDYAAATAHLSIVEDGAYSRLIRIYYRDEGPLPAELKAVQRLVSARSRDEREAVQTVLEEFFELREDGWHQARCDEELVRWRAQAEANRRVAEEREARKRARIANATDTNRGGGGNESSNESFNESSPSREPSQKPLARSQKRAIPPDTSLAPSDPSGERALTTSHPTEAPGDLPAGTDPAAWAAWENHHRAVGRWSAPRRMLALGQLRTAAANGANPTEVLTWATVRGLADLADAARRMAADAAKEQTDATRRRPGESLADHSARLHRGLDERDEWDQRPVQHPALGHG